MHPVALPDDFFIFLETLKTIFDRATRVLARHERGVKWKKGFSTSTRPVLTRDENELMK
jgi:hypothetical protein